MRTPNNERLAPSSPAPVIPDQVQSDDGRRAAHEPVRRCILSGDRAPRAALVRLALGPDGQVHPDVRAKAPGRGAWIGVARPEMEAALAKGRLGKGNGALCIRSDINSGRIRGWQVKKWQASRVGTNTVGD